MKKKLSLILTAVLLFVMIFNTTAVFADEQKMFIHFYVSLRDSEISAVSYKFDPEYVVRYYASDDYPEFLDDNPFKFEVTDENGAIVESNADGTWTLPKGNYKIKWSNVEEIKEQLKEWDQYENCDYEFPEEDELCINISVDGQKSQITFYSISSSTTYVDEEDGYIFNPAEVYSIQLDGIMDYRDYYKLPAFLLFYPQYKFEVKTRSGKVLTEEELAQPLAEGTYILTWNNMDEIKKLIEESDAEIFERYEVVFPDEPLTTKFTLSFDDPNNQPTEFMGIYGSYCLMEGGTLPAVKDLFYFSDIDFDDKDAYPECLENVVIEYYDAAGNKIEGDELTSPKSAGVYTAKWVNFYEFLEMDEENGWGLQEKYYISDSFDGEYPECVCEFYAYDDDELGSVFGNGALTIVLAGTTLICIGVIIVLAAKLKKQKAENQ